MKTQQLRFDVFGREIVVEATPAGWAAFIPGNDGKRRPADFPIPANLDPQSIAQYLDDQFHESATAEHDSVKLL